MSDFQKVTDMLDEYVNSGRIPGYSVVIADVRERRLQRQFGLMDIERKKPVTPDTLFRIYSMTKPITSVALMQLWQQSAFDLSDPVSDYLPGWESFSVFNGGTVDDYAVTSANATVKIVDLLRHTAGLTYGFEPENVVDQLYHRAGLTIERRNMNLAEGARLLASLPLRFEPGTRWHYSFATDVVGHLVEVISGTTLDQYLRANVFEPLGMRDTGFYVSDSELERFAACYCPHPEKVALVLQDDPATSSFRKMPNMLSGGGGLVSTVDDYLRFCRAMLSGGHLEGYKLLEAETVELMISNHLPGNEDLSVVGESLFTETTYSGIGFGLGYAVVLDPAVTESPTNQGEYSWGGMASTYHWIDPVEQIIVVFMTQLIPSSTYPLRAELKQVVHDCLTNAKN
ncbi:MAG: serine hydrolase domain-containing protein [Pseudomonadota bacterium]